MSFDYKKLWKYLNTAALALEWGEDIWRVRVRTVVVLTAIGAFLFLV